MAYFIGGGHPKTRYEDSPKCEINWQVLIIKCCPVKDIKIKKGIIFIGLTSALLLFQSVSCERNGFLRGKERKMPEPTLFGYDEWKGKIEGPITRYHNNFNLFERDETWSLIRKEILSSPEAREVEYRYVIENRESTHLRIVMAECGSISGAHELIFSSLNNIVHPDPPLDRPNGWHFGDVYKLGYWARDNIFVHTIDLSDPPWPKKISKSSIRPSTMSC
jgi:hypothetical protein